MLMADFIELVLRTVLTHLLRIMSVAWTWYSVRSLSVERKLSV